MGREVRRVPKYWRHPKDSNGSYQPMFNESYEDEAEKWMRECELWSKKKHPDQKEFETASQCKYYWEWAGNSPEKEYYMPKFSKDKCTHYQMYETCSEGTPISPVMETPEKLANWLVKNCASSFGNDEADYDQWLGLIKSGDESISAVMDGQGIKSGVTLYRNSEGND